MRAGGEREEKFLVVVEGVFEIRVLNEDEFTGGAGKRVADGVAFAARFILEEERNPGLGAVGLDDRAGAIGGVAFDEDELEVPAGDRFGHNGVEGGAERRGFVENGHDHRERAVRQRKRDGRV